MIVVPFKHYGEQDGIEMTPLIDPDNSGPWAVRYLWVQHTQDNNKFYNNYFDPSFSQAGMNIRKQTADLKSEWAAHNQIFFDSAADGNLVWRAKVGNPVNRSIDYIEIWRSCDIVKNYFSYSSSNIESKNTAWQATNREEFNRNLFEAGFDIRDWRPYTSISKELAIEYYKKFVEQHKNKDRCIINTPWNKELNPL
jgi:hypothetical protein